MNGKNLRMAAATAGAAGVLSMGALTAVFSGSAMAEPEPAPPGPVETTEATLPETTTETTPPTTPTIPSAEPEIKGPADLPEEEEELPG